MARNGSGVYSIPAGTAAVSGDPISSSKFNTLVDDLVDDANDPRPVVAGGTGASSASGARTNLGLGTASTSNVQSSNTDTTATAALTPGAFGWGETGNTPLETDVDDLTQPTGAYRYTGSTSGTFHAGASANGYIMRLRRSADNVAQIAIQANNNAIFHRTASSGTWSNWRRLDVPAGAVQAFALSSAPVDWLECDGSDVSRTTYADLFAAIGTTFGNGDGSTTFGLPDLRGEFVRGWDNGKGTDSGRTFGSSQDDAMQGHEHSIDYSGQLVGGGGGYNLQGSGSTTTTDGIASDGTNGTPRTASETRPRNISLMYCIKA